MFQWYQIFYQSFSVNVVNFHGCATAWQMSVFISWFYIPPTMMEFNKNRRQFGNRHTHLIGCVPVCVCVLFLFHINTTEQMVCHVHCMSSYKPKRLKNNFVRAYSIHSFMSDFFSNEKKNYCEMFVVIQIFSSCSDQIIIKLLLIFNNHF